MKHVPATSIDALERRVAELEAQLRQLATSGMVKGIREGEQPPGESGQGPKEDKLPPIPGPDLLKEDASAETGGDGAAHDAGVQDEEGIAQDQPVADDDGEGHADDASRPESPDAETTQLLKVLPTREKLESTLKMLIGNELTLKEVPPDAPSVLSSAETTLFASHLINDAGDVIGVMAADLVATIYVGGGLLMMPPDLLKGMVESEEVEQDILESLSEVFNTTSALLNEPKENPHVRTRTVGSLESESHPWFTTTPLKVEYEETNGGRLVIAAREL